jgi:hypothetical protein
MSTFKMEKEDYDFNEDFGFEEEIPEEVEKINL